MKKQLKLLYTIQSIDLKVRNSEELRKKHAAEIESLSDAVSKEEAACAQAKERVENHEKKHRERERELKGLEEQKSKIEEKMLSVKTNKEYQASLQEIETIKQSMSAKEDDIIVAMDAIEDERRELRQAEELLAQAAADFETKKEQIEKNLQQYLAEVEKEKQQRDEILREIDPGLLQDYQKLCNARNGIGIVLADSEMCLGCNMQIPPQMYNEAVVGEKLITCPHCRRILYVDRSVNDPGQAAMDHKAVEP